MPGIEPGRVSFRVRPGRQPISPARLSKSTGQVGFEPTGVLQHPSRFKDGRNKPLCHCPQKPSCPADPGYEGFLLSGITDKTDDLSTSSVLSVIPGDTLAGGSDAPRHVGGGSFTPLACARLLQCRPLAGSRSLFGPMRLLNLCGRTMLTAGMIRQCGWGRQVKVIIPQANHAKSLVARSRFTRSLHIDTV